MDPAGTRRRRAIGSAKAESEVHSPFCHRPIRSHLCDRISSGWAIAFPGNAAQGIHEPHAASGGWERCPVRERVEPTFSILRCSPPFRRLADRGLKGPIGPEMALYDAAGAATWHDASSGTRRDTSPGLAGVRGDQQVSFRAPKSVLIRGAAALSRPPLASPAPAPVNEDRAASSLFCGADEPGHPQPSI